MTMPPPQNPQNPQYQYPPQPGYPAAPPAPGYPAAPPAPTYQAPYGQPPMMVAQQGTNGMAIAALITGILGINLLAWIFGGVALSQIKRTGQNGRGMAIAGIVLGLVWVALVVILVAAGALTFSAWTS